MPAHRSSQRFIPALVIAVCICAVGAALSTVRERAHAMRPAADAPVHVVHAPACATCALGAGRSLL